VELVGLAVAVVSEDLDVVEHALDDLLVDPLQLSLNLKSMLSFVKCFRRKFGDNNGDFYSKHYIL
jgi:hypothetical protein